MDILVHVLIFELFYILRIYVFYSQHMLDLAIEIFMIT